MRFSEILQLNSRKDFHQYQYEMEEHVTYEIAYGYLGTYAISKNYKKSNGMYSIVAQIPYMSRVGVAGRDKPPINTCK